MAKNDAANQRQNSVKTEMTPEKVTSVLQIK
jgi:hypothetical protein